MAKQISSMAELIADVQGRLNRNDPGIKALLKNSSGESFAQVQERELREAADALKSFLESHIQRYYGSYPASEFRTGQLGNSIMIEMLSSTEARVYFNPGMSYGNSLFGGGRGYKPALIDKGWIVSRGNHKNTYRFGFYEGFGFIDAAIGDAKGDGRFKHIEIMFNGYA